MSTTSNVSHGASNCSTGGNEEEEEVKKETDKTFECNICLDTAHDAVVSMCGHLFWWVLNFLFS